MFIGHFAVGFAAKAAKPNLSLGVTFAAAQLLDLLWPVALLMGVEEVRIDPGNTVMTPLDFVSYPFTHSLLASILWGLAFGAVYYFWKRDGRGAALLAAVVPSHWVLDLIAHRPDLPLIPGDPARFGFGLWNHPVPMVILEVALFAGSLALYMRRTCARNAKGRFGLWALVAVLVLIWAGAVFGPPPPDVTAVAVSGNLQWLFVFWAAWVDRNRQAPVAAP